MSRFAVEMPTEDSDKPEELEGIFERVEAARKEADKLKAPQWKQGLGALAGFAIVIVYISRCT